MAVLHQEGCDIQRDEGLPALRPPSDDIELPILHTLCCFLESGPRPHDALLQDLTVLVGVEDLHRDILEGDVCGGRGLSHHCVQFRTEPAELCDRVDGLDG